MFFSRLSIKIKLMVTLGIVSVMLVAVGLLGINDLQRSNQSLEVIYSNQLVPGNALAMAFEILGDHLADRRIVLHDQNARCRHSTHPTFESVEL